MRPVAGANPILLLMSGKLRAQLPSVVAVALALLLADRWVTRSLPEMLDRQDLVSRSEADC